MPSFGYARRHAAVAALIFALATATFTPLAAARTAGSGVPAAKPSLRTRIRSEFKRVGVIASVGFEYGPPIAEVMGEVGVLLRPTDPATGTRSHGLFAAPSFLLGPSTQRKIFSPTPELRGRESILVVFGRESPIFGDRVVCPIVPGVLALGVGRKGGLGFIFSAVPLPFHTGGLLSYPLLRGNVSLYVDHPALSTVSGSILDWVNRRLGKPKKAPLTQRLLVHYQTLMARLFGRAAKPANPPASISPKAG